MVNEAEDILELENTLEPTTGDRDSDRAYAQGLLLDNGAAIAGIEPNNENLYHGMREYARAQGLNPIGEKMSAQLFMKTCKLSYDYVRDPLFTEEELQHMESNPKILFYGMKQANNLMKGMLEAETRRKQQGQENQMPDQPARPFAGLSVTPLYSDIPIPGPDGKAYADGEILQGEAAYGFLVQLNALDKERFDAIQRGEGKAAMAELLFSYGSYDHKQFLKHNTGLYIHVPSINGDFWSRLCYRAFACYQHISAYGSFQGENSRIWVFQIQS